MDSAMGPPGGLIRLQAPVDLFLGALAQILMALMDDPDELVLFACDLIGVVLGELIPPSSQMWPDLCPLLGKRLGTHACALPTRGV
jgi:hypothetical protein